MTRSILVAVAHPDDEVLGCGGTIARHASQGDVVHIVIFADGTTSRVEDRDKLERRAAEARAASAVLGAKPPILLGFPDQRLDGVSLLDLTQRLEARVADLAPSIVYTHHGGDLNHDHQLVYQAVLTAFRPLPGASVRAIRTFETLSSTEWSAPSAGSPFAPSLFIDITHQLALKQEAMATYASELRAPPHPRSHQTIEALARLRGSTAGLAAAEAFMTIREVEC